MTTDLVRSRLARREWVVTFEVATPARADAAARERVFTLAEATRDDARLAGLALTDRTASLDADPIEIAPDVAARGGKTPLVHVAGKGRDAAALTVTLERARAASIGAVLLTGGDPMVGAPAGIDAVDMLRVATPDLLRLAVLAPLPGRPLDAAWDRALAKRDAGAAALVTQVTWDLAAREGLAEWQARLGIPMIGAVMLLTRGRLSFLAEHHIGGIAVPPALRARIASEAPGEATHRLALDLVLLRRLGYAGAHVSGLLTPARVTALLDEANTLESAVGDGWRDRWREAAAIA